MVLDFQPRYAIPTVDHSWSGPTISATAGENVALGDVCYLKSDGKFWRCDANAEATLKGMIVMATAAISADAAGVFLLRGIMRDATWTWTVGAQLYVPETPGNPTETIPAHATDLVRVVGWALDADDVYFDPSPDYIELV